MEVDLKSLSLEDLKKLQKDVAKAISGFEARRRNEALAAAKAAAREAGYDLDDLLGLGKKSAKAVSVPKYQHPENPSLTWSGRGRQPAWFKEALASGNSQDDLSIG